MFLTIKLCTHAKLIIYIKMDLVLVDIPPNQIYSALFICLHIVKWF